jgi:hypothetical protein
MPFSSDHDIVRQHVVKVVGGGKSLSVLAAPPNDRTDASYQLSDEARETLVTVLAEDIEMPQRDDA